MTVSTRAAAHEPLPSALSGIGEAVVQKITPAGVRVRIGERTRLAMPALWATPEPGQRVLVLEAGEAAWVVGVLSPGRPGASTRVTQTSAAQTSDGVRAAVHDDVLVVHGADGELLFTHDAKTGTSQVVSRALRIRADHVDIEGREVALRARDTLEMAVAEQRLTMSQGETRLEGERLSAQLGEGRFSIRDLVLGAHRVEAGAKVVRQVYEVVERRAERVVERTRDSFREIEGVDQTRSGRMRLVAKKAFSLLTETASLRAEDDFAIVAEKIELG